MILEYNKDSIGGEDNQGFNRSVKKCRLTKYLVRRKIKFRIES